MTRERLYRANIVEGWHIGCVREHKKVNALYVTMFAPYILLCVILSEGRSPKSNPIEMSGANAMRARSTATQGSRNEFDLSCQRNVTFCSEGAPTLEDATFPLESYW